MGSFMCALYMNAISSSKSKIRLLCNHLVHNKHRDDLRGNLRISITVLKKSVSSPFVLSVPNVYITIPVFLGFRPFWRAMYRCLWIHWSKLWLTYLVLQYTGAIFKINFIVAYRREPTQSDPWTSADFLRSMYISAPIINVLAATKHFLMLVAS